MKYMVYMAWDKEAQFGTVEAAEAADAIRVFFERLPLSAARDLREVRAIPIADMPLYEDRPTL